MAILESSQKIELTRREIAVNVAQAIADSRLPVPSSRIRSDVNYIQIDPIIIEHRVTNRESGIRLQFVTEQDFGVTLNINLREFSENPEAYLHDLFEHIRPMLRNGQKLRMRKDALDQAMHEVMIEEAAANG